MGTQKEMHMYRMHAESQTATLLGKIQVRIVIAK